MTTDLQSFRPLVANALVAFGIDFHYGVEIAKAANRLTPKRGEMEHERAQGKTSKQ